MKLVNLTILCLPFSIACHAGVTINTDSLQVNPDRQYIDLAGVKLSTSNGTVNVYTSNPNLPFGLSIKDGRISGQFSSESVQISDSHISIGGFTFSR